MPGVRSWVSTHRYAPCFFFTGLPLTSHGCSLEATIVWPPSNVIRQHGFTVAHAFSTRVRRSLRVVDLELCSSTPTSSSPSRTCLMGTHRRSAVRTFVLGSRQKYSCLISSSDIPAARSSSSTDSGSALVTSRGLMSTSQLGSFLTLTSSWWAWLRPRGVKGNMAVPSFAARIGRR